MPADPRPTGTGEPQTLEERAREIIWRVAVWQDDDEDPLGNCTWAYAQEYEGEMGELVPRTIDAAREVHAVYAEEIARLRAEVEKLEEERDDARALSAAIILHQEPSRTISWLTEEARRLLTIEARAARLEEALKQLMGVTVHPDQAVVIPAAASHMRATAFGLWAQAIAFRALNPEGGEHGD